MLVIPAIDIIEGKTVRLTEGDYAKSTFYDASPEDMVKRYVDYGFYRIHSVDLDGAKASAPHNLRVLEKMAKIGDARIEWSGGIKKIQDVIDARNAGASYISLGSLAVKDPELFIEMLSSFGPDFIILSADAKDGRIAVKGWTENTDVTVTELVRKFLKEDLSQAIVTDISRDGTFRGIDTGFYQSLQGEFPSVDFTVSGGVADITDIEKCREADLRRVIVGKAIYEHRVTLAQLARYNDSEQ